MPDTTTLRFDVELGDYGADRLRLTGFRGFEEISQLFSYEVDVAVRDEEIDLADVVGQAAALIWHDPEGDRSIYGIVSQFERLERGARFTHYRARVVPRHWLLTLRQDCRIFQNLSVVEIITEVLQDGGIPASEYEIRARGNHPKREYCVQYRESDWNFVSRLAEEEGIFYFFDHSGGFCKLVMVDDRDATGPVEGEATVPYKEQELGVGEKERISHFRLAQQLRPSKVVLRDFDFKRPSLPLESEAEQGAAEESALQVYDYPGEYTESSVGGALAQVRLEELRAAGVTGSGEGTCLRLQAGYRFTLEGHALDELNREYLVTRVQSVGSQPQSTDEDAGVSEQPTFRNSFECIAASQPFRPRRLTPRPRVEGPQTAIVRGPAGEEIHCDEYGRVKVQFHWDREGRNDDRSSCWLRANQGWAGSGWGMIIIPRIGQEVVVDFLEGDPDQPIIMGRVYNGESPPPYSLPDHKTRSSLMSSSSPGGGGYNEFRLEDSKGGEEIFLHAEKDWNSVIENDRTTLVKHDETSEVGHDRSRTVKHDESVHVVNNRTKNIDMDQTETIGRNKTTKVAKDHSEQVGGNMDIAISGMLSETVSVNYTETVSGAMELTVGGPLTMSVGGALSMTVGSMTQSVGGNSGETVGGNKTATVSGNVSETVSGKKESTVAGDAMEKIQGKSVVQVTKEATLQAKKVMIQAQDEITIKAGSAQIILKKSGDITIKGKKIDIKGSGDVVIKGTQIKEN